MKEDEVVQGKQIVKKGQMKRRETEKAKEGQQQQLEGAQQEEQEEKQKQDPEQEIETDEQRKEARGRKAGLLPTTTNMERSDVCR